MKTAILRASRGKSGIIGLTLLIILMASARVSPAADFSALRGVVTNIEGDGVALRDRTQDEEKLNAGDPVSPWDTLSARAGAKLLVRWGDALQTSMGAYSALALVPSEQAPDKAPEFQTPEGIVRFAPVRGSDGLWPFTVTTPTALITPEGDKTADFIIETYEPAVTVVTVISGSVKVRNLKRGPSSETVIYPCQSAYVDEKKDIIDVVAASSEDLKKLADDSTIKGTILARLDVCEVAEAPTQTLPRPVRSAATPSWDGVYVPPVPVLGPWYDDITVSPYADGGCWVSIPLVGSVFLDLPYVAGWVYDPVFVLPWVRRWLCDRSIWWHRRWLGDWGARRGELHRMIHLAQASRNPGLWWRARRELDNLRWRSDWANRGINHLQDRVRTLDGEQGRFRGRIPSGVDMNRVVADSFGSSRNAGVLRNFEGRVRSDMDLNNRLVRLGGSQTGDVLSRMARERNPEDRLALRNQLGRMRTELAQGQAPVPSNRRDVQNLVTQISNTSDPRAAEGLQKRLSNELNSQAAAERRSLLSRQELSSLKGRFNNVSDPQTRRRLQQGFSDLEKSVRERRQANIDLRKTNRSVLENANSGLIPRGTSGAVNRSGVKSQNNVVPTSPAMRENSERGRAAFESVRRSQGGQSLLQQRRLESPSSNPALRLGVQEDRRQELRSRRSRQNEAETGRSLQSLQQRRETFSPERSGVKLPARREVQQQLQRSGGVPNRAVAPQFNQGGAQSRIRQQRSSGESLRNFSGAARSNMIRQSPVRSREQGAVRSVQPRSSMGSSRGGSHQRVRSVSPQSQRSIKSWSQPSRGGSSLRSGASRSIRSSARSSNHSSHSSGGGHGRRR